MPGKLFAALASSAALLLAALTGHAQPGDAESRLRGPERIETLTARQVYSYVESATMAIFLHEVGHALIDLFSIPNIADEEDAADRFAATFIVVQAQNDEGGHRLATSIADFLYLYAKDRQLDGEGRIKDSVYADTHDFGGQRAFSFLCYIYGFGELTQNKEFTSKYDSRLVDLGADRRRLERCATDARKNFAAWNGFLAPRYRNPRDKALLRELMLSGDDGALEDFPRFRVTYTPGEPEADGGLFYRNERLRYFTLAYLADLLTLEFDLGELPDGTPRIGSVDIYSRGCGEANAFYTPARRSVTICHELQKEMADALIRYHTRQEPSDWWTSSWLEHSPAAEELLGVWSGDGGWWLELNESKSLLRGGAFTLRRGGGFQARHGVWGVEGDDRIWLIETRRDGSDCFNPGCRPSATADGLTRLDYNRLRAELAPQGTITGSFRASLPSGKSCGLGPQAGREDDAPGRDINEQLAKLDTIGRNTKNVKRSDAACDRKRVLDPTIEIDGVVFHHTPLESLGNEP